MTLFNPQLHAIVVLVDGTRVTRCPYTTARERAAGRELVPLGRSRTRCPRCGAELVRTGSKR